MKANYTHGLDLSQSLQGAGGILARIDHGADKVHIYFYDANGNVGQLVDSTDGSIAAAYEYAPFGGLVSAMGTYAGANPFRFSSKYADEVTGLYYYGFRYYSPGLGRWMNRDPIGEDGGVNLYGFVLNDGINHVDLLGKKDYWIGGGGDRYPLLGVGPSKLMKIWVMEPFGKNFPGEDVYRGYEDLGDIVADIEQRYQDKPCEPINLIGHSYGGAAAIDIAAKLKSKKIKVNVLITLDPVSAIPRSNPNNYVIWVNVYQKQGVTDIVASVPFAGQAVGAIVSLVGTPAESHDISDVIATTGSQLGSESGAINIERNYHHWEAHKFFLDALKKIPSEIRQRILMPNNN